MIRKVSDIMTKDFCLVNPWQRLGDIQDLYLEKNISCFPVSANNLIEGILTCKQLIKVHPNRIAADAMSDRFMCINSDIPIWQAKEILDAGEVESLLIKENSKVKGFVDQYVLNVELSKYIDPLTGLYRSEYIFYKAAKLIKSGSVISILFLDINNFGYIDKRYGHVKGDLILKAMASLLKNSIETETHLCRYGGDEFAILTPYCLEKCKDIAEKLLDKIKGHDFPDHIPISAAAGIVGGKRSKNISEDFLFAAAKLMNKASLASTKAKKDKENHIFIEPINIDEIA